MEALDAILSRRSRKEFVDKPIEFEKIAEILNAGNHAPSAGNLQNWRFLVITDKERILKLPRLCEGQECVNAPIVIIVCSNDGKAGKHFGERSKFYNTQNCAAAVQNMLLAANNYALGAVWIGIFNEQQIKQEFEIPDNIKVEALIALGYSNQIPHNKHSKELREVVFFNKWNNRTRKIKIEEKDYSPLQERFINAAQSSFDKGINKLKDKLRLKRN